MPDASAPSAKSTPTASTSWCGLGSAIRLTRRNLVGVRANYAPRAMSASKVRIAAAAALAVGVALAASPASARTAVPKGSCKLLTVREVGEILGTPSDAGKQKTRSAAGITGDRCVWEAKKKGHRWPQGPAARAGGRGRVGDHARRQLPEGEGRGPD